MRRLIVMAAAALSAAAPAMAQRATAPVSAPKLIVAISVDQFSANLFEAWRPRFTAGLARLSGGIVYPSGYQSHAATETCPGHSTLLTGRHPNKTGIVGNNVRDPATGKEVYCLADADVVLAHDAAAPPVGPKNLMVDTVGEWLKAKTPGSRVVAVSGKDRGAINMAGHNPDGVFWLIPGYGFTTYIRPGGVARAALAPIAPVNAAIAPVWTRKPTWTYAHPDCRAADASFALPGGLRFESHLPPQGYGTSDKPADIARNVMASPIPDELTLKAAQHLIEAYRLGRGPATDLLAISFSATDYVGHGYGTRGPEMCEQMHRLDETVGALLTGLDRLGIPYLVALSADHGGSDLPERLAEQGYDARRLDPAGALKRVNAAVMASTGLSTPPLTGGLDEMSIIPRVADADRPRVLEAAKRALAAEPDVAAVFTLDEALATPIPHGKPADEMSVIERFAESAYRGRSGDLLIAARPYSASPARAGYVGGHGSVWNYDRRVPILFWWKGAPAQTRFLPIETVDIAPTLAAVMGLAAPADVDGRCLPLTGSGGGDCPKP
nr:Type I phosphodiesterase/nucleotide pyrophosphatase [uncultured organism]